MPLLKTCVSKVKLLIPLLHSLEGLQIVSPRTFRITTSTFASLRRLKCNETDSENGLGYMNTSNEIESGGGGLGLTTGGSTISSESIQLRRSLTQSLR